MSRLVFCGKDVVWKYVYGEQPAELHRVPVETGVGRHSFVELKISQETDQFEWRVVDPARETFNAEVLVLLESELPRLAQCSLSKSLGHFSDMLRAFVSYGKGKGQITLVGEV